jgi:hypothetical protein
LRVYLSQIFHLAKFTVKYYSKKGKKCTSNRRGFKFFFIEKQKKRAAPVPAALFIWLLRNLCAHRHQAELCQLEALLAERYADYCYVEYHAPDQKTESQFPTEQDHPDNVADGMFFKVGLYGFAEGQEGELGDFKALLAEGYADYRYAENGAEDAPAYR